MMVTIMMMMMMMMMMMFTILVDMRPIMLHENAGLIVDVHRRSVDDLEEAIGILLLEAC
jgi:hypothetical protein